MGSSEIFNQKPMVVGIAGRSGSGKSSFINGLRNGFDETELTLFSLDDYYKDRKDQLKDAKGYYNFDLPTAYDKEAIFKDIQLLLSGNPVSIEAYVFKDKGRSTMKTLNPSSILLIEGLFTFNYQEWFDLFDIKVLVECPHETAKHRRLLRDISERNYEEEEVLYRYENHALPAYYEFIEPQKDVVDLIVNNHRNLEKAIVIFQSYFRQYLDRLKAGN